MEKIYRHGDVLLVDVGSMEVKGEVKTYNGEFVVAEGEHTGHAHRLRGNNIKVVMSDGMAKYLILSDTCQLLHEEHNQLQVAPSTYEIIIENEYDYFEEEIRKVRD